MGISDSGMDARCFSLTSPSLTKQKGTPSFSVPLSLTILFLFHAKDKNKDNGKKDIFACTDFFSLSAVVLPERRKRVDGRLIKKID